MTRPKSKRKTSRADRLAYGQRRLGLALVADAARSIDFVHAAIPTRLVVEADGLHVQIETVHRDSGEAVTIDLRSDVPTCLPSREFALDWIYSCVREAWVHELNEALFVDGARRRDLHNHRGQTIPPPEETDGGELVTFKAQLAKFLRQDVRDPVLRGNTLDAFKMKLAEFLTAETAKNESSSEA